MMGNGGRNGQRKGDKRGCLKGNQVVGSGSKKVKIFVRTHFHLLKFDYQSSGMETWQYKVCIFGSHKVIDVPNYLKCMKIHIFAGSSPQYSPLTDPNTTSQRRTRPPFTPSRVCHPPAGFQVETYVLDICYISSRVIINMSLCVRSCLLMNSVSCLY